MATTPTQLPVPSEKPQDLKFNAGKIDCFVTSLALQYIDRFGGKHYTIEGLRKLAFDSISSFGWILIESFEDGATLTIPNAALLFESNGEYYRWAGSLPKTVPAGSTPQTTGGVGPSAWVGIGDASLRAMLATSAGASMIGTESGKSAQESLDLLYKNKVFTSMSQMHLVDGESTDSTITLTSFHEGLGIGGGVFQWSVTMEETKHNGGTIIDPDKEFPATWDDNGKASWYTANTSGAGAWVRVDYPGYLLAEWFGATPWVIGGTQDSTKEFQQCANIADHGGTWRWTGRHRITNHILIPEFQTFGSFGQMTSVSVELFDRSNFQGVHTSPFPGVADKVDSAVFYDSDSGDAFWCMAGAVPDSFLLYGKGYNVTGVSLEPSLPHAEKYYDTSGIRHGKYIKPQNVTIILFKRGFDSTPFGTGGSYVGDYYSVITNCEVMWCNSITRVSTTDSYNTKFVNLRAVVNRMADSVVSCRNFVFIGGSIESFNETTSIRPSSNISFNGTYFETFDSAFNGRVFDLRGWCSINIENALVYMNYISEFISSGGDEQSLAVGSISLTGHGNTWRRVTGGAGTVYSVSRVPSKSVGVYGDIIYKAGGSTITYYTGNAPAGLYYAPISIDG